AEDCDHQDRGHHSHHDPPGDVAAISAFAQVGHPYRQVRPQLHVVSPFAHRASDVNVSRPGNSANRTVTGRIKKTTGTIMEISLRPPASSNARLPTSRTSTA